MRFILSLVFASLLTHAAPLDDAFQRLYNFDFAGANRIVDTYAAQNPADPMVYSVRASSLLFQELDRMHILEAEFFGSDKRVLEKRPQRPDPEIRKRFFAAVNEAQERAKTRLATAPNDVNALFAIAMSTGLTGDYNGLVEKHQWASLTYVKQSTDYAGRVLRIDPNFTDAYLTVGLTEYLVGSLPFFLRWFVHIDGVDPSKQAGEQKLERVAQSGRYLKPFAKILLAVYYLREKQPARSADFLRELTRDFPENPLFRRELAKLQTH
jgi:hypothetical protein